MPDKAERGSGLSQMFHHSPAHPPPSFPSTSAVELLYFHRALTVDHLVQCTDLDSREGGIIDGNYRLRVATVEFSVAVFDV